MHRSLFDRVGGFEESFASYGGEDWEVANRCWLAGAQMRYVPDAVAWHDGVDFAGREVDRRAVQNGQAATLARLLPSPATRPPGPVWEHPLVVAEVDDRGWTDEQALLAVAAPAAGRRRGGVAAGRVGRGRRRTPRPRPAGPGRAGARGGAPPVPHEGPAVRARRARRAARGARRPGAGGRAGPARPARPAPGPARVGPGARARHGGRAGPTTATATATSWCSPSARTCSSAGSCGPGPSAPADPSVRRGPG